MVRFLCVLGLLRLVYRIQKQLVVPCKEGLVFDHKPRDVTMFIVSVFTDMA